MKKHLFILIIIAAYSIAACFALFHGELKRDEIKYHYPLVKKFEREFPDFDFTNNYSSASTPVPYIILAALGKIVPINIYTLRIATIILSILTLIIFYKIVSHLGIGNKEEITLLLLFQPYYLTNSSVFYMPIWGMFFGLFSLYIFLKGKTTAQYFTAGLLSALAILSRQYYLFLPAAYFLFCFFSKFSPGINKKENITLTHLTALMLPHIVPIAFFIFWGGISSPEFRGHEIAFKPMNIIFAIILVGFYFCWSLIDNFKLSRCQLLLIVFIPLFFLFLPKWSPYYSGHSISGIVMHLSDYAGHLIPFGHVIFLLFFYLLGLLIITQRLTRFHHFTGYDALFLFAIAFFILIMAVNMMSGERHFLPGLPFFLLWLSRLFNRKNIRIALCVIPPLSIFYLYYYLFLV
jgi:hypothetical protein